MRCVVAGRRWPPQPTPPPSPTSPPRSCELKVRHSHGPIHINTNETGPFRETCLDDTDTESYFSRELHAQDRSPNTSRSPSQEKPPAHALSSRIATHVATRNHDQLSPNSWGLLATSAQTQMQQMTSRPKYPPVSPAQDVTSNGQDGARGCQISPDSHPAQAVPARASRTPGPSRQS